MSSVKLDKVSKIYAGDVHAVTDFSIDIEDKEFIILVGPSGCGKSTTLRMIAGLEEISQGELYIDDKIVNDVHPKDRDIAMVFQSYALYPHMTVFDNMAFGLKLRHFPKSEIRQRVDEAAKILGIEYLLDRKPKALSGGQRQRVALGRAIVRSPKVFLLDEPLSNLDAKLRSQMRAELSKLHRRLNTTFIYVTHDQVEAMTMGSRIVVMKDGFIQQIASPKELYESPVNVFVGTFIGSPQMNIVEVSVSEEGGACYLSFGKSKIKLLDSYSQDARLKEYIGKQVLMGIRPESLHDEESFLSQYPDAVIECFVDVVEFMGSETHLHLTVEESQIIAKVTHRSTAKEHDTAKIVVDPNKIHLFDKETEKSILL